MKHFDSSLRIASLFKDDIFNVFEDQMNTLIKSVFGTDQEEPNIAIISGSYPKIDIKKYEDKYIVEAEVPGLTKDQVKLEIKDSYLIIKGNKQEKTEDNGVYVYKELKKSNFSRAIKIDPKVIDMDGITASFDNSILQITLPLLQLLKNPDRNIDIA